MWPGQGTVEMLLENNHNAPPLITDGQGQSRRAAGSVLVSGKTQLKGKMLFTHFSENNQQGNYTLGNTELNAACCHTTLQNERELRPQIQIHTNISLNVEIHTLQCLSTSSNATGKSSFSLYTDYLLCLLGY